MSLSLDDDTVQSAVKIVRLNISGTIFECDTLIFHRFPDSVLGRMFSEENKSIVRENDCHFFDRDIDCFKMILQWYRSGIFPQNLLNGKIMDRENAFFELNAWGFDDFIANQFVLTNSNNSEMIQYFQGLFESKSFQESMKMVGSYDLYFHPICEDDLRMDYYKENEKVTYYNAANDGCTLEEFQAKNWRGHHKIPHALMLWVTMTGSREISMQQVSRFQQLIETNKFMFQLAKLLNYSDGCSEDTHLKAQVDKFLGRCGFMTSWKREKTTCGEVLPDGHVGTPYFYKYFGEYPFDVKWNCVSLSRSEFRTAKTWCEDCQKGVRHRPNDERTVHYLQISTA